MTEQEYRANILSRFGPQTMASLAARENAAFRRATGQPVHGHAYVAPRSAADPAHVEAKRRVWKTRTTARRDAILALVADGCTSEQVAERLRVSIYTVRDDLTALREEGRVTMRHTGRTAIWEAA